MADQTAYALRQPQSEQVHPSPHAQSLRALASVLPHLQPGPQLQAAPHWQFGPHWQVFLAWVVMMVSFVMVERIVMSFARNASKDGATNNLPGRGRIERNG